MADSGRKLWWVETFVFILLARLIFQFLRPIPFFGSHRTWQLVVMSVVGLVIYFAVADKLARYLARLPWYVLMVVFLVWIAVDIFVPHFLFGE